MQRLEPKLEQPVTATPETTQRDDTQAELLDAAQLADRNHRHRRERRLALQISLWEFLIGAVKCVAVISLGLSFTAAFFALPYLLGGMGYRGRGSDPYEHVMIVAPIAVMSGVLGGFLWASAKLLELQVVGPRKRDLRLIQGAPLPPRT